MPVDKEYYPLDEAAQKLGGEYKAHDLVHFGAQGNLGIHVLADGWPAYLWEEKTPSEGDNPVEFALVPHSKRMLTGPLPLPTEVLQKYEANTQTSIDRLPANGCEEHSPDDIQLEYRLCTPDDPTQPSSVTLADYKIVVMDKALKDFITEHPVAPLQTDNPDHSMAKGKAPTKFVAALIKLLVEVAIRAAKQDMPFSVTEMPGIKADLKALADKFDACLEYAPKTFDDYIAGLCQFKQGAKPTSFYKQLFPEYFK